MPYPPSHTDSSIETNLCAQSIGMWEPGQGNCSLRPKTWCQLNWLTVVKTKPPTITLPMKIGLLAHWEPRGAMWKSKQLLPIKKHWPKVAMLFLPSSIAKKQPTRMAWCWLDLSSTTGNPPSCQSLPSSRLSLASHTACSPKIGSP